MRSLLAWTAVLFVLPAMPLSAGEVVGGNDLPGLMAKLARPDAAAQAEARNALVGPLLIELPRAAIFGKDARPAIADVRTALQSKNVVTRVLGAAAASRLGLAAKQLLPQLVSGFNAGVFAYDYFALEAIRKLGPDAAGVAATLATAVHTYADHGQGQVIDGIDVQVGRDAGIANLAALRAMGPAGTAALRTSMAKRSYVRPLARASLTYLAGPVKMPPPAVAPNAAATVPILAPATWLTRLEAEVKEHGIPGRARRTRGSTRPSWPNHYALFGLGEAGVPALVHALKHGTAEVQAICTDMLAGLGNRARLAGPALFELVAAKDVALQDKALATLGTSGASNPAWLDTLLPFLARDVQDVPLGAVLCITGMGPAAERAREPLLKHLRATAKWDAAVNSVFPRQALLRDAVLQALGAIGGPPEVVIPALLEVGARGWVCHPVGPGHAGFRGPPWERPAYRRVHVRESAANAIGLLGLRALPQVRAALNSDTVGIRATAARALAHLPLNATWESAIRASRDDDADVRKAALPALARSASAPSLRALMALLEDGDGSVVSGAIATLAALQGRAEAAASTLATLIVKGTPHARQALKALDRIKPDAQTMHAPTLVAALNSGKLSARDVFWRLKGLGPDARVDVAKLVSSMHRMSAAEQIIAIRYLHSHAPSDLALHGALKRLAIDGAPEVRVSAVRTLALLMSPPAVVRTADERAAVLDTFVGLLTADNKQIATSAARALADVACRGEGVVAALKNHLDDPRETVRVQAVRGVVSGSDASEAAPAATALLASEDKRVRAAAVQALAAIGDVSSSLPTLRRMLTEEKAHRVRIYLLDAIASTGAEGLDVVRKQLGTLKRRSSEWHRARAALAKGGAHIVPELRTWLRGDGLGTYVAAASMLRSIGRAAEPAAPDLFALADSGKQQALHSATGALYAIRGPDAQVMRLVERCLRGDMNSRNMAVRLLRAMKQSAYRVFPALEDALPFLRGHVLGEALQVIENLSGGARAVPALLCSLPGAASHERAMLLRTLGVLATRAPSTQQLAHVRSALHWGFTDPVANVRSAAARGLIAAFRTDAQAIEGASRLLSDADGEVQAAVATALAAIGVDAKPAVPALLRAAQSGEGLARTESFRALGALDPSSDVVLPVLLRLAASEDPWRARSALATLGRCSGEQAQVDALLASATTSWDWRIRLGASEGLSARKQR